MKIFFVIPGDGRGRNMLFARDQIDWIESNGADVYRFFWGTEKSFKSILYAYCSLVRNIWRFSPDVVCAQYGTLTALLAVCSSLRPLVVVYRGSDLNPVPSENWLKVWVAHLCSQFAALLATRIICVSRKLSDRLWFGREKVTVIPSGINLQVFKPMSQIEARLQLGLSIDASIVFFNAGNTPKVKRLDLAESAFECVARELPGTKFIVMRDFPHEQVPVYLNAADVLLITSDYEGSPTILKEAIACGLPVVSVDAGDAVERLRNVTCSKVVPGHPRLIAEELVKILKARHRSNGPAIAAKELSHDVVGPQVMAVLCEAQNSV